MVGSADGIYVFMTFIPYQIYRFEECLRPELRSFNDEKEINL
jgi:hypothetical protein